MLDLLRILLRWRKPLLAWSILAALVAGGVTFTLTPRYYSQASILPPHENAGFGGISMLLQQYAIPIPGGIRTPFLPTLYASIVRSRHVCSRILEDFDLRAEFKGASQGEDLETLRSRTFLRYTDEGILLVGYQDADPQRAADITNAFVRYLDEFIQKVNSQRAGDTRVFIEGQVQRCNRDLAAAEEALRDFQKQHRAIEIDAQTAGAVEIASRIQIEILAAEVELGMLRQHATADAHEVQAKTNQLRLLRDRYRDLLGVEPGSVEDVGVVPEVAGLFPQFREVPDLALRYARLLREVKVQMTLHTMLLQQLEQARIEEAKNTRVLSVLDWAEPGETPVFPRRFRITGIAALAAFFWVAIFAVFVEKVRERREDEAEAAQLTALHHEWQRMPDWVRNLGRRVAK
jgi:capsular polysaccharide biosynthesis protein